jgi:hypothetical protein
MDEEIVADADAVLEAADEIDRRRWDMLVACTSSKVASV